MEGIENIVNVAMNSGMSLLITCYFLFRDWKYQQTLTSLLGSLSAAIDRFIHAVDNIGGDTHGNS